jgi:hypothetical protein
MIILTVTVTVTVTVSHHARQVETDFQNASEKHTKHCVLGTLNPLRFAKRCVVGSEYHVRGPGHIALALHWHHDGQNEVTIYCKRTLE